ncbi:MULTISPECIES: hypothetical protein [unclassified Bradyrhizobium]|nr:MULTISPECIES: hypothetical protein [unclassified Bradyrhizobium]
MEPERKDQRAHDVDEVEQDVSEREEPTLPFASEGLEQVRDTHC